MGRVPLYHTAPYNQPVNEFTPGAGQPPITRSMQPPSECGDRITSYVVPELFQFGASGYRELCLIAWFCTPPISGYMLAKRMHESNPCWKYIFPFVLIAILTVGWIVGLILRETKVIDLHIFWMIFGPLFGVGCLISFFVLANLTRQRHTVS